MSVDRPARPRHRSDRFAGRDSHLEREREPMATITRYEASQVEKANATGKQPVVFVHGLWLLPSSWDRWASVFKKAGYVPLPPGWPDDPATVGEAKAHPETFAQKSIGEI